MSDLISRSAVIDVLKEAGIIQDNDLGHLVVGEIERIPTACDMEQYNSGYAQGLERGIKQAFAMKENADGCKGCAFEQVESWQMPCDRCKRNSKDYWRAKAVE